MAFGQRTVEGDAGCAQQLQVPSADAIDQVKLGQTRPCITLFAVLESQSAVM